jgi:hypothetical protein
MHFLKTRYIKNNKLKLPFTEITIWKRKAPKYGKHKYKNKKWKILPKK